MTGLLMFTIERVPLDDFVEFVLPSVHNAPIEVVLHYVRQAAIEFAQRTNVLKDTIQVDVQMGVGDYRLDSRNTEVSILAVNAVSLLGRPLSRLNGSPVMQSRVVASSGYWFEPPGELFVVPNWSADLPNGLIVEAILQPTRSCESLPRRFYDDFAEGIAAGALHKMLLMKTADWYDPQTAGINNKQFKNAIQRAQVMTTRGNSTQPLMARTTRWC